MAVSADSGNSLPKRLLEVLRSAKETIPTDRHSLNNDLVQQAKDAGLHEGRCKCSKQAFDRLLARVDCIDGVIVAKISRKVVPAREDWPAIVAAHHVDDDGYHRSPQRTLQAVSIRSILSIFVFQCSPTDRHVFCCRFLKRTPRESVSLEATASAIKRTGHVQKAFFESPAARQRASRTASAATTATTEMHFVVVVPEGATRAWLVFQSPLEVRRLAMACEEVEAGEATMFSLVTTLARRHVFKYTFSIAQGEEQKGRDEQQEREVIPTRQCSTGRRVEKLDQRFRVLRDGVKENMYLCPPLPLLSW